MRSLTVEELMKRQWNVSRTTVENASAHQRWDQAYQLLLQWAKTYPPTKAPPVAAQPLQEVSHASSPVCPCIDQSSSSPSDD